MAGDERAVLTSLLAYQRNSLLKKLDGIDDAVAAISPVGSGTSLLWLINHMADAETTWVLRRFAGQDGTNQGEHETTVGAAIRRYRAVCAESDSVIAQSSLDELCHAPDDGRDSVELELDHAQKAASRKVVSRPVGCRHEGGEVPSIAAEGIEEDRRQLVRAIGNEGVSPS